MSDWWSYLPYFYIGIECSLLFIVSIVGVYYVRSKLLTDRLRWHETHELSGGEYNEKTQTDILRLYWEMRNVYTSFIVHVFDVFTDYLIVIEWFELGRLEKQSGNDDIDAVENVDPTLMAYFSVSVLIVHKISCVISFWMKEKNISRCILAFFGLIIFQEIYVSHKSIIHKIKNNYKFGNTINDINKHNNIHNTITTESTLKDEIQTTTSFKFVRHLEAMIQSFPQVSQACDVFFRFVL